MTASWAFLGGHGLFAIYQFSIFDHSILVLAPLVRLVPPVLLLSQLVPRINKFEICKTINIIEFPRSTFHFTGIQMVFKLHTEKCISSRPMNR